MAEDPMASYLACLRVAYEALEQARDVLLLLDSDPKDEFDQHEDQANELAGARRAIRGAWARAAASGLSGLEG